MSFFLIYMYIYGFKTSKMCLLKIMEIGYVWKESGSTHPKCWAGTLSPALLEIQSRCSESSPASRGCFFCLRISSQVWPAHLFCSECCTAAALHFTHSEQSAKRQPPRIGHHNPHLMLATFNQPVLLPEVIRGQMRNGNRVLWCECDSHCHALLDLCQSKWRETAALNCLFLSITLIWGIFMLGM